MTLRMWIIPLALALLIAGDLGSARQSCAHHDCGTNCCMLPCIAQELVRARRMLASYAKLARKDNLTQADLTKQTDDELGKITALADEVAARSPQCAYKNPKPDDEIEMRRMRAVGFKRKEAGGQRFWDYSVGTDDESCEIEERKLGVLRDILPCPELVDITRGHEKVHQAHCEARRKAARGTKLSPQGVADDEVAAYRTEIKLLTQLFGEVAKWCEKSPCKGQENEVKDAVTRIGPSTAALKAKK